MSVRRSAVSLSILLLLALAALGTPGVVSSEAAEDSAAGAVCIEDLASFDPLRVSGGCFGGEEHIDAIQVVGFAVVDGDYPSTALVEAHANGVLCGSNASSAQSAYFEFYVLGAGERKGCATLGDAVKFSVNGRLASETIHYSATSFFPVFQSLTVLPKHAWYWFERVSIPAPSVGLAVEAFVNGQLCGAATLGGEDDIVGFYVPPNIRGFRRLVVPSTTVEQGCAQNGSLVEFRVNGVRAETAVQWQPGVRRLVLMVQGDANCDFLVDSRDALLALQVTATLLASVPCHGDADRDRDIDVYDARHILEFAAGIFDSLPL